MITLRKSKNMGGSSLGWLESKFHFSFAEYYNPNNMNFGELRVINDDLIQPNTGFPTHPHKDMEIVTYIIDGKLTHRDNMGNERELSRGHVQYLSAGTGIHHSEYNATSDTLLRLLQIWIMPDQLHHTPQYGDQAFDWDLRTNKWFHIVGSTVSNAPIKIHQDVNIHVLSLDQGQEIDYKVAEGRQAYLVQIEGSALINDLELESRDALESKQEDLHIKATTLSHYLVIEGVLE